eukprot:11198438-Lingulodinium_polyedra.AAC.1
MAQITVPARSNMHAPRGAISPQKFSAFRNGVGPPVSLFVFRLRLVLRAKQCLKPPRHSLNAAYRDVLHV